MSKENVDLIIRATDKASKDIATITKSLKEFTSEQDDIADSAKTADTGLSKLGDSFKRLNTAVDGLNIGAKVNDDLKKVGGATTDLDRKIAELSDEYNRLDKSLKQTGNTLSVLERKTKGAAAAEQSATDKLKNRTKVQKDASSALKDTTSANNVLTASSKKLNAEIVNNNNKVQAGFKSYLNWEAKIRSAGKATKAMQSGLDRATAKIRTHSDALLSASAAQVKNQRAQLETSAALVRTQAAYDRSTVALERQAGITNKIIANRRLLNQSTSATIAQQRKLEGSLNRVSTQLDRQAVKSSKVTAEARDQTRVTNSLSEAYRKLYGDSRRALSVTQRLRGQVLSLIAAYAGFYGVVNILGQVVGAYQTLEAAQARLNVVFEGDEGKVAEEMEFLRRTANRLGIDLGALSQEYSKFSIATQDTALEGDKTRKIFIAVAEAAVVNRSTVQEMSGVFVALTQIVSKGAVQMEELRQQLGDRLPGAIKIMADGLGVTTAELVKMMEQGQVTAEALVPFAEELERRFGPGLEASLLGVTVQIGRMKNAIFQAMVAFGNQGFLESFSQLMNDITETIQSADFEEFSSKLSVAFATLTDAVGILIKNFDVLVVVVSGLIGVKLTPFILAAVGGIGKLNAVLRTLVPSLRAATIGTASLTAATRTLLISTGIGAAVVAISTAIGLWATNADTATAAMNAHRKIVDLVKAAYEAAGGAAENWADVIEGVTVVQAKLNLTQQKSLLADRTKDLRGDLLSLRAATRAVLPDSNELVQSLDRMIDAFDNGQLSASDLKRFLDNLFKDVDLSNAEVLGERLQEAFSHADEIQESEQAMQDMSDIIIVLTGTADEAQAAMIRLNGGVDDAADAMDSAADDATAKFQAALQALNGELAETKSKLDETLGSLRDLYSEAIDASTSVYELADATDAYNSAVASAYQGAAGDLLGGFSDGLEAAKALIIDLEGFRSEAYYDVNAFRAGFGSDTVTLSDGSIVKITEGMRVSVEDANRDLNRRLIEFTNTVKSQIGAERFSEFNAQQQAALTSIAYNYGALPDRILGAVRSGTSEEIAASIRGLGSDNEGVNRDRRGLEAGLFTTTAGTAAAIVEAERAAELQRERTQAQLDFNAAQAAGIEQADFELSIAQQNVVARETAAALREAETKAQEVGLTLTEKQRTEIARVTEEKFRQQLLDDRADATRERAVAAEKRVNDLISERSALSQQLEFAAAAGDQSQVEELRARIEAINAELLNAVSNAQDMWAAVGGADATVAIENLEVARQTAASFGDEAKNVYAQWDRVGDMFVNKLASAFDSWAEKIAAGESIWEATRSSFLQFAGDFLREIAQMILKQAIFNALKAAFGGTSFGSLIGINHDGGMAGSGAKRSGVSPALFAGAMRYHEGGVPGLRPGELPIIVEKEEEVLTRDDPRHVLNGGKSAGRPTAAAAAASVDVKVVIPMSPAELLREAIADREGQQVIIDDMQANPATYKAALGM